MTIDENPKGADGGVYSTCLHDDIPPRFFFYYLVTVVPLYFHKGELYYTTIPFDLVLEVMLQHRSRYEEVDIMNEQRKLR